MSLFFDRALTVIMTAMIVASFVGCSKSTDTGNAGFMSPNSRKGDAPNPYPIAQADREAALARSAELKKELADVTNKLIAPSSEDVAAYADFLSAANTGLFRLFPRESSTMVSPYLNGSGAYYQFKGRTNEYGYGDDIEYSTNNGPTFSVGFGGVDYGFFAQLGQIDIRTVTTANPAVGFALHSESLNNQSETRWRSEQQVWSNGRTANGILYKDRMDAVVGMTYVGRSVNESGYDIITVFQVIRRDPMDNSLVLAFKIIGELPVPKLAR